MGFLLKTNNRKMVSGLTLKAKIVSPDKQAYDYDEYPIIIKEQTLSDQDKILRDYQVVCSTLDSNNRDWIITNKINGLDELSNVVNYSTISYGTINNSNLIDNGVMDGERIVDEKTGKVIKRPPYDVNNTDKGFTAIMQLTLTCGTQKMSVIRPFTVPMWTKEQVLKEIMDKWTENNIWKIIRGNNSENSKWLFTNLNIPNEMTALQALGLTSIINTSDNSNIPSLTFTYPTYYTTESGDPLIKSDGTVALMSAKEVYALSTSANYRVTGVQPSYLTTEQASARNINVSKSKGETVLYRLAAQNPDLNNIVTTWSYDNTSSKTKAIAVEFLSNTIAMADIISNIKKSVSLGWFMRAEDFNSYFDGIVTNGDRDQLFPANNDQTNRMVITINPGKHVQFRLPSSLDTLLLTNTHGIVDHESIGYAKDINLNVNSGFVNAMLNGMSLNFQNTGAVQMSSSLNSISVDNEITEQATKTGTNFDSGNAPQYIWLNSADFDTLGSNGLQGSFTINLNINSIRDQASQITVYFTIKKKAS